MTVKTETNLVQKNEEESKKRSLINIFEFKHFLKLESKIY